MYYFVYHINTIALYCQEKPTSLMNENKWINNPQITSVKCVGANCQDGKRHWITITKTTMVVIFNLPNSHLLNLSSPTEEVFQVKDQNRLVANLPVVNFHYHYYYYYHANTKATEYVTFGFFLLLVTLRG